MKQIKGWGVGVLTSLLCLSLHAMDSEAGTLTAGKTHLGTFEGSTTFTTSSSNGIHPGLFLEVRDADGNLKQYTSEEGVITVENTKEGAYVTQAKLLGKTKYVDQDSGEILDQWEAGRNLKLESVQKPVLTTVGRNLWNPRLIKKYTESTKNDFNLGSYSTLKKTIIKLKPNTTYKVVFTTNEGSGLERNILFGFKLTDKPMEGISEESARVTISKNAPTYKETLITTDNTGNLYLFVLNYSGDGGYEQDAKIVIPKVDIHIEESKTYISTEPFQSNLLTVNEEITLRGIGDARDELDLVTGEVVQHIDEVMLDKNSIFNSNGYTDDYFNIDIDPTLNGSKYAKTASKPQTEFIHPYIKLNNYASKFLKLHVYFNDELPHGSTFQDATTYLKKEFAKNSMKIQYQLATELIETVTLTSTYAFNLISDGVVKVNGNVIPTIYSVTVPSQPLTFAINPNAEAGQQFIAPEFSITNEGTGPVELELKSFSQKTNVLNDVLPDHHSDWTLLDKTESRDFALALVPKASDAWLTLQEGPKYVANTANTLLGKIKPKGTVDFSFTASHGTVFDQNLFPEYQLVFTFGF